LVAGLVEGRLDLILIALPHDLPPQIVTLPLFEDGYALATPREHPLANLSHVEGPDLEGRELLLLERGHCLQQHALSSMPGVSAEREAAPSRPPACRPSSRWWRKGWASRFCPIWRATAGWLAATTFN
jgi:DNA-binding transcriptional LysR family regulator